MLFPVWRMQYGALGVVGAAPNIPIFLDSTQSRWVTPHRMLDQGTLVEGIALWVKPPTITSV